MAVRDEMFPTRRARILERRRAERAYLATEIAPAVSSARRRAAE